MSGHFEPGPTAAPWRKTLSLCLAEVVRNYDFRTLGAIGREFFYKRIRTDFGSQADASRVPCHVAVDASPFNSPASSRGRLSMAM
jgi:hypothetical protein